MSTCLSWVAAPRITWNLERRTSLLVLICSLGTQTFLTLFYQKPREWDMIYL